MDISEFLAFSLNKGVSNLHMSSSMPPMTQVNGDHEFINIPPLEHKKVEELILSLMNERQRIYFDEFMDINFATEIAGLGRFRVSAYRHSEGLGANIQIIPSRIISLDDLRAPKILNKIAEQQSGLVLVTGPLDAGKTTLLAAMIDHRNETVPGHILTIEDPIEFIFTNKKCLVTQREIYRDSTGLFETLNFTSRLRPSSLFIGEGLLMNYLDQVIALSMQGSLVFSELTIDTQSIADTVEYIDQLYQSDSGKAIHQSLCNALQAVISQRLVKRDDGGRVAVHEIMLVTPTIREHLRNGRIELVKKEIEKGTSYGMQTMDMSIENLLKKNIISSREAKKFNRNFVFNKSKVPLYTLDRPAVLHD